MKRKLLSLILSLLLLAGLSVSAAAVQDPCVLDISEGDIFIEETGYRRSETGTLTPYTGTYVIEQKADLEYGTLNSLVVVSGHPTVTLRGKIFMNGANRLTSDLATIQICGSSSLHLILEGEAVLKGSDQTAAIEVPATAFVHIKGADETDPARYSLTCISNGSDAIGSSLIGSKITARKGSGQVTLDHASVTVNARNGGAGIAAYSRTLDVADSIVNATATGGGAAIGGRVGDASTTEGGPHFLRFRGSSQITATASDGGAAIGGGRHGAGVNDSAAMLFYGSVTVNASATGGGAAIGGGAGHVGVNGAGRLEIYGSANITATASDGGAAIGGGQDADGLSGVGNPKYRTKLLIREQAQVTARADRGAAIGGGENGFGVDDDATILIDGQAQVLAESKVGSGIGGGHNGNAFQTSGSGSGLIKIAGEARVEAISLSDSVSGAGIGGYPLDSADSSGTIWIAGGTVQAVSKNYTEGVGLGNAINLAFEFGEPLSGTLKITGGHVTAEGAYGIGQQREVSISGGVVDLCGNPEEYFCRASYSHITAPVGGDAWIIAPRCHDLFESLPDFRSGTFVSGGRACTIYGVQVNGVTSYVLPEDVEIPAGCRLKLTEGQQLIIPKGRTLTVNGHLLIEGGELVREGQLILGPNGEVRGLNDHDHTKTLEEIPQGEQTDCGDGYVLHHWQCTVCGQRFEDAACTKPIGFLPTAPGGHMGPFYLADQVMPDCKTTQPLGTVMCSNCNTVVEKLPTKVTALGGHVFNEDGKCEVCGKTREELMAAQTGWISLKRQEQRPITPGSTFVVDVMLDKNPGIASLGLELYYEDEALELIKVEDQGLLTNPVLSPNYRCPYGLFWMDNMTDADNTSTGCIAQLTFKALTEGPGVIQIGAFDGNIRNSKMEVLTFGMEALGLECVDASVSITKVEVKAAGTGSAVDVTIEALGKESKGSVLCAAYDEKGRLLGVTDCSPVTAPAGTPRTVTLSIDVLNDKMHEVRAFYLDDAYAPLCPAMTCTHK